eukprot:1313660-Pyramimonas_sp.AAC.1
MKKCKTKQRLPINVAVPLRLHLEVSKGIPDSDSVLPLDALFVVRKLPAVGSPGSRSSDRGYDANTK